MNGKQSFEIDDSSSPSFPIGQTRAGNSLICKEPDGTYDDPKQCDKYFECYDGVPEERLCPDGLVFDPYSRKREPCDHYFNVDCGDRLELREHI